MEQRCYLPCEEGGCECVACPCSELLFVLGGGAEGVCALGGEAGGNSMARPSGP